MSAAASSTNGTALYGVTGWPLAQTLSPLLHNTGFRTLGINALYQKWEVPPEKLPAFVESVRLLDIRGCSVTIPHKVGLLPLLDEVSPLARQVGAANTIYWNGDRLCGENTDVAGFMAPLADMPLGGADVLLLGAGGAGSAVAHAVLALGARRLRVVDTDRARAQALAAQLREHHSALVEVCATAGDALAGATGMIHATPTGMAAHPGMPLPAALLRPDIWVSEIVYFPHTTELLRAARALGCRTVDGGGMAVGQAVGAFELFTGLPPDPERMARSFRQLIDAR